MRPPIAHFRSKILIIEVAALILSVIFAETPWLIFPSFFAIFSVTTYVATIFSILGSLLRLVQVVSLTIYYGVPFASASHGSAAAEEFGRTAIPRGAIVLFDKWLSPDPGEPRQLGRQPQVLCARGRGFSGPSRR